MKHLTIVIILITILSACHSSGHRDSTIWTSNYKKTVKDSLLTAYKKVNVLTDAEKVAYCDCAVNLYQQMYPATGMHQTIPADSQIKVVQACAPPRMRKK